MMTHLPHQTRYAPPESTVGVPAVPDRGQYVMITPTGPVITYSTFMTTIDHGIAGGR